MKKQKLCDMIHGEGHQLYRTAGGKKVNLDLIIRQPT